MHVVRLAKNLLLNSLTQSGIQVNRLLLNPSDRLDETIWICGDGRSGTTWLANLINHANDYRLLFEPLHPVLGLKKQAEAEFRYLRPGEEAPEFRQLMRKVFLGRCSSRFVEMYNKKFFYRKVIVKDIFAHLYLKWVDMQFPQVKKVVIIRHPIATALSKYRLTDCFWMTEPGKFLQQKPLLEDFLAPFEEMLKEKHSYIENQVLIWSVIHYVLLRQCSDCNVHFVFFEDLLIDAPNTIGDLHQFLHGGKPDAATSGSIEIRLRAPSETVYGGSAQAPVARWKTALAAGELNNCERILAAFELHTLYQSDGTPNRNALPKLLHSPA